MEKSKWIPEEMDRKEKDYILDHLTSLMTWFAYMAKLYRKEAIRLDGIVKEIRLTKTRGD